MTDKSPTSETISDQDPGEVQGAGKARFESLTLKRYADTPSSATEGAGAGSLGAEGARAPTDAQD